ncbi:PREDICTED: uncharacterized protein LOC107333242 isoform X1 [Acropora digitifera]|uniref:uncharacterized protein LOC107333242 isoform X1 n=1 Tax=Acropora digitifera TaxID=70779 RepID=UPI00077B1F95|nr:PREDICTED: uncharacterized protein LOC107333242 isoform X1 [Acropora digitifera]
MRNLALMILINAFLLATLIALLQANVDEFKEHGKAISRGGHNGAFSFANFKQDKFSYLNVTVLEKHLVDQMPECSFACLETSCFSFNLNAFPDIDNKLLCELLPVDKYNNTNKFIFSNVSHHFSIMTPCSSRPCKNNGTCVPLYEENDYKCACKRFTGRNCESDFDECSSENECHTNATCTNTNGSYNCTCKRGFQGDGRNCNDTDECSYENECHVNATCQNTKGSYNCICLAGFQGDGRRSCTVVRLRDSVIIGGNQTYFDLLSNWLNPVAQSNGQWILCWRASLNGWASSTLHSLCNNKGPTVSLIRDTKNNVFGGYASKSWRESGNRYAVSAFLFSLKNPTNDPRKLPHMDGKSYSMRDYGHVGPSFGQGIDLYIASNANKNSDSYEKLGYTYTVPSGRAGDPFLTGATRFTPSEIETFYETTP